MTIEDYVTPVDWSSFIGLYVDGVMVGAIGVSGGTAQQDIELGVYGKEKLKDVIAWN